GVHLIRTTSMLRQVDGDSQEVLSFLGNGKPIKTYRVCDLVDFPWLLPHSSSHYEWKRKIPREEGATVMLVDLFSGGSQEYDPGIVLDENARTLRIMTLQGGEYLFNIDTGAIITSRRPIRWALISFFGVFGVGYAFYLMRRFKRPVNPLLRSIQRLGKLS